MNVTKAELAMPSTVPSPSPPQSPGGGGGEGEAGAPQLTEVKSGQEAKTALELATEKTKRASPGERTTRESKVDEAIRKVNDALRAFDITALKLFYDRKRELVIIQVLKPVDGQFEKDKVIRQIPPEEFLKLAENLRKLRQGLLFDQRV